MGQGPIIATRSIDIAAEPSAIWQIIVSPAYWQTWMLAPPTHVPSPAPVSVGDILTWENEHGETYLRGTVTRLDRDQCFVLELDDVSWKRSAAPGVVTYSMTLTPERGFTRVDLRLGDLAIDRKGEEWRKSYLDSRELQTTKDLAEGRGSKGSDN
jgi:hypothetical protein